MNDLFRVIFGVPSGNHYGNRMDSKPPDNYNNNIGGNIGGDDDDDDDDVRMNPAGEIGFFNFPLFNDAINIHVQFKKLVDEMNKSFGGFGFGGEPSIMGEDEENSFSLPIQMDQPRQRSLRDEYLKNPDCGCARKNQSDNFNWNVKFDLDPRSPETSNSEISPPKVYAQSVFIRTIRRPDGSVETIHTVRDHTGNEKTTITQTNVNDPSPPPAEGPSMPTEPPMPTDSPSGLSIFKKFFPF